MRHLTAGLLGAACAALLAGCVTIVPPRTQEFPGKDYATVFNGAVAGVCDLKKKFVVYAADQETGVVDILLRGGNHLKFQVLVSKGGRAPFPVDPAAARKVPWLKAVPAQGGEAPTVLLAMPGNWPHAEAMLAAISQKVTAGAPAPAARPAATVPAGTPAAPAAK